MLTWSELLPLLLVFLFSSVAVPQDALQSHKRLHVRIISVEDRPTTAGMIKTILEAQTDSVIISESSSSSADVCVGLKEVEADLKHDDIVVLVVRLAGKRLLPCEYLRHLESVTRLQLLFGLMREKDAEFDEERYATAFIDSRLGFLEYDLIVDEFFEQELTATLLNTLFIANNREVPNLIPVMRNLTMEAVLSDLLKLQHAKEANGTPIAILTILTAIPGVLYAQYFVFMIYVKSGTKKEKTPKWFTSLYNKIQRWEDKSKEELPKLPNSSNESC